MLKKFWWRARQFIMPLDGMTVGWKGYRFLLFLDDPTCRWLWTNRFTDFEEFACLSSKVLRPGDTVLDVGAHYGYVATVFSAAVGQQGTVLAVEAAPHTVARLRKQLTLAGCRNVRVVPRAIGERCEIRTMQVSFDGHQDYQCVRFGSPSDENLPEFLTEEILVQVTPLDVLVEMFQCPSPCLVKIDIEGGELPALHGAVRLLQQADPPWLMVEINPAAQARNDFPCSQLLDFMRDYSELQYVYDGAGAFIPLSPEQVSHQAREMDYFNLLVRPPHGKYSERPIQ